MPVIFITGCSTGIGYVTAENLARNGNTVYATMRNSVQSPKLQRVADKDHLPLHVLPLDVLNDESVEAAVNFVMKKEGHIDVLINNAGISSWGAVEELTMDSFTSDMNTNYFGTVRCIKAVLPSMRERKSGTIINISSIAGKLFSNFHSTYCASKAAVEAFSESLAQEVQPFNIKVVVIEPSIIETPIFNKAREIPAGTKYPGIKRYMSLFAAALEAHDSPEKVAELIKEIVSGKAGSFRRPVGITAEGFLNFRTSMSDDEWVNSVSVTDEEWVAGMEQMGLPVGTYMRTNALPQLNKLVLAEHEV
ncbi:SDR family oxidoreductase [Flavitalea sp.]|nr:SDR family oxidoreductase [Flavitalea sp.]